MNRIAAGVAFAPLASGALQGAVMQNLYAAGFALVFAYPFTIFLGLPAYFFFKSKKWLELWHAALFGVALAIAIGIIILAFSHTASAPEMESIIGSLFLFGMHGLVVSVTFWFISIWNNSDVISNRETAP